MIIANLKRAFYSFLLTFVLVEEVAINLSRTSMDL